MKQDILNEYMKRTLSNMLLESQESKSISAAIKLYMDRTGQDREDADEFVRVTLRNDIPTLRDKKAARFILGVTRMYLDGQIRDADTILNLNRTLKYVASDAHINEYDRNLNGMTAQALIDRFSGAVQADVERDRSELASRQYGNQSQYDIVRINSFEEAERYGKYVSWCVTYSRDMYNSYTSDGINVFYFCLRKGFENEEKIEDDNCPLDSYGLSMIAVSVLPDGALNTCTCRWNHDNGGTDSIMDTGQISQVIGMNFYSVFKGNEEYLGLAKKCKELGINMRDLIFSEGFAAVELNGKWNLISKKGEFLSPNQWFDRVYNFDAGFARVLLNDRWNFIGRQGNILSPNLWFDSVRDFNDGFAHVGLNGKWNLISRKGQLVSLNQWFDDVYNFFEDFVEVELNGKCNLIDKLGKLLSPNLWFDWVDNIFYHGYAKVELNGEYNFISKKGKLLSPKQWFNYDYVDNFANGYAKVRLKNKWNFIDKRGKLLSPNQWFDDVDYFHRYGYAKVLLNNKWYLIDKNSVLYDCYTKQPIHIDESKQDRVLDRLPESEMKRLVRNAIYRILAE